MKIPRAVQSLLDSLTDEDLEAVARVYREAMNAMRRYWVDEGRDERGCAKGHWVIEPDHKTRLAAANMVASYREGLPVQRQLSFGGKFDDLQALMERMEQCPSYQRPLARDSLQKAVERGREVPPALPQATTEEGAYAS